MFFGLEGNMPLITPEDYRPHAEEHEGRIPWMYLDRVGVVTIGIGHALPTLRQAKEDLEEYGWDGQDIAAAWGAVKDQPKNKAAKFYKRFSTLRLGDYEIDGLFEGKCRNFLAGLQRRIPKFEALPAPAQLALLDMAYNLGVSGLANEWPKLMTAVAKRDWAACVAECNRPQLSQDRNDWTRQQFALGGMGSAPRYIVSDPSGYANLIDIPARASPNPREQPAPPGPPLQRTIADVPPSAGPTTAPAPPENPKPLTHSRTMIGSVIAAISTAATTIFDQGYGWLNTIQEWTGALHGISEPLTALAPTLASMKGVLLALALAGIAYAIYARYDDRKKKGH